MMNLAIANCKMTTEEAFKGVTRNAALSLGRDNLGIIDIDADADLLIWKGIDKLD
jgi:imidazolonepropionase-like amidohydrolase